MNERSRRAATRLWCPLLVRFLARATRQISSPKRRATTGRCRAEFRAATEPESHVRQQARLSGIRWPAAERSAPRSIKARGDHRRSRSSPPGATQAQECAIAQLEGDADRPP